MDIYTERLAGLLTDYSLEVKEGQRVGIFATPIAAPMIKALYRRILEAGAHPFPLIWLPGLEEIFYQVAGERQLDYVSALDRLPVEEFDAGVSIMSSPNTRALSNVPPEKMSRRQTARRPLFERLMDRIDKEEVKWCGAIVPTNAYAQDAEMSLEQYSEFLYKSCGVYDEDSIDNWRRISAEQSAMVDWMKGKKTVRIRGVDTDLEFSIEERTFINCDGRQNMPDGEIFTSPVEDSVRGKIRFSYPVCTDGREIENINLVFEDGVVVSASAGKGEDYLITMLDSDEGSRRVGEFGIGNNPGVTRFTKSILFDEKIKGTVHLALGLSFPEAGGKNRSAIHWDMICDLRGGGEVLVDGDPLIRDGRFCWSS